MFGLLMASVKTGVRGRAILGSCLERLTTHLEPRTPICERALGSGDRKTLGGRPREGLELSHEPTPGD